MNDDGRNKGKRISVHTRMRTLRECRVTYILELVLCTLRCTCTYCTVWLLWYESSKLLRRGVHISYCGMEGKYVRVFTISAVPSKLCTYVVRTWYADIWD